MKKIIVLSGAILLCLPAWADEGHGPHTGSESGTSTEETEEHAPYEDRESSVTGLTLAQYSATDGTYVGQSELRINMADINGGDISGLDLTQSSSMNGGSFYDTHLEVNAVRLYGGMLSSSSIRQSATINNATLRSSTVQLNKLYIR